MSNNNNDNNNNNKNNINTNNSNRKGNRLALTIASDTIDLIEGSNDVEIVDTRPLATKACPRTRSSEEGDLQILLVKDPPKRITRSQRTKAAVVDLTTDSLPEVFITGVPGPEAGTNRHLSQLKCGICLGEVNKPMATVCGHIYCEGCLKLALRQVGMCPACRRKLKSKDVHRLYI